MIWNHLRSLRFQVQFPFLVLTITSVYSFFSDKMINGKPDACSLISSVAFAIMSLSLSRQTQCGFEVDLLYFFLGNLIVQLMKIKLELFIVGAGFSYSLIILRSSFPSISVDEGYPGIQDENLAVLRVISPQLDCTTDIASSMMDQFRTCVTAIQKEMFYVMDILLEQLKEYFDDASELMLSERSNDGVIILEALCPETVNNLQEIVKLMVNAGFEKECSNMYSSCRRECLEECLVKQLLGLGNLTFEEASMISFKDHRRRIKKWIKASKVALKILFPTERQLCDIVFFGFSAISDLTFTDVCRECAIYLLNFPNALVNECHSPVQLFRMLNLFETLGDLIPNFESLFCDQYSVSLTNEANTVLKKLGEAIVFIFTELENIVRQDPVNAPVCGGGLHPIVRYMMKYLTKTYDNRQTLEQVFEDHGHMLQEYFKLNDNVPSSFSLSLQMERIMEVLETNLEAKSKIYKDPALPYVFLMNSSVYIIRKTEHSGLRTLFKNGLIKRHQAKLRYNYEQYLRISWNKVQGFLNLDNNGLVLPDMVEKSMKKKLESFNILFEEMCRVQSLWFVLDKEFREEIITSIADILLPAYGNFIQRFQSVLELEKHADKYTIKYGSDDIEARLSKLFKKIIRKKRGRTQCLIETDGVY
ncbi:exocyst complex component EXO70B1 [Trifolium repens]|nr:exocyst complex component EXO70B1 [Trifolium repens]